MSLNIIWLTTQFPNGTENKNGMFIYRTLNEISKNYSITAINLYPKMLPIIPALKNLMYSKNIISAWYARYPRNPIPPSDTKYKVRYLKYYRLPRGIFHYIESWFAYTALKKYLINFIKDKTIFHAAWLFPEGDLANIVYKKYNVPFVVTLMGSDVHYLQKGSRKWYKAKEIIRNASYVTSVSQQLYYDLEKKDISIPANKRMLTHTIYEVDKFNALEKDNVRSFIGLKKDEKIIFFAGTLRDIKNIDVLITAFSNMLISHNEIKEITKLIIAGKGEEEGKLRSYVKKLNLEDKIIFTGGLNTEEMIKYYNAADVFCLPSKNEGLPNVIVEALLCGTPVVASSVGEIPFVIEEEKNGYLVPPNDHRILAQKLEKALLREWDRKKLRESVNSLNPANVFTEYENLYKKMEKSFIYE